MSITLIHGNAVIAIANRVNSFKKDFDSLSISEFGGKSFSLSQVLPSVATGGLFSEKKLVILEDFETDLELDRLPNDDDITLILRFNRPLSANSKLIKGAQLKKISIINLTEKDETSIFPFLDGLSEKNKRVVKDVDSLIAGMGGQYLLTMIFYMLRRIAVTPKNLPPFILKKIENQKKNFPKEKIIRLYKESLETDYKIKTGVLDEKLGLTLLIDKILRI